MLLFPTLVIAYFTLGILGQLSATFTFLLVIAWRNFVYCRAAPQLPFWLLTALVLVGPLLYASTFGISSLDVYAWGYDARWLALTAALLALLLWKPAPQASWAIALALAAFVLGVGTSRNLWDYLLDAMLSFTGVYWLVRSLGLRFARAQ
jgi:hypothetical protein